MRQHAPLVRLNDGRWVPHYPSRLYHRGRDFGGCRCQAYHLTGDAGVTDPACALSPERDAMLAARADAEARATWVHRGGTLEARTDVDD